MTFVRSWRTALRIARREARRARGRSALVVAMIALPVLFLSFAAVTYDMFTLTGTEKADRRMGAADARIEWSARGRRGPGRRPGRGLRALPHRRRADGGQALPTEADLLAGLPAGTAGPAAGPDHASGAHGRRRRIAGLDPGRRAATR